ncbi:MAG: GAF domain-containing protein [Bryobacterales bacterium]|nr:GAF domain-containing protein [Bryobacterales bacterium]
MELRTELAAAVQARDWQKMLAETIAELRAESGSLHLLGEGGVMHLTAAQGIPEPVLAIVKTVPVGKGMAGLAAERKQPVTACNIQRDTTGDVRPGARATGMEGAIVVPVLRGDQALGALGVANRSERTFTDEETALLLAVGRAIGEAVGGE